MMRSMYSAVTGLRAHQGKMDTIGNNISNVNTVGFKRGQVTFSEVFNQTVRGASSARRGKGGLNPQQIGLGVGTGSISTIHTSMGGIKTDNPLDLMIEGEGFFVVSDDPNFNNRYFSRAGNFFMDNEGNIVTSEGYRVLGYGIKRDEATGMNVVDSTVTGLRVNKSGTAAPKATEHLEFRGNLNSNTPPVASGQYADATSENIWTTDTVVRDSLGNGYKVTSQLIKVSDDAAGNTWAMRISRITDLGTGDYVEYPLAGGGQVLDGNDSIELKFDASGRLVNIAGGPAESAEVKLNLSNIEFTHDQAGTALGASRKPSGTFKNINIFSKNAPENVKNLTQYANVSTAKSYSSDGQTSGNIESFSINAAGELVAAYSNGDRQLLGQVLLAKFDNPMGLEKMGGNMFIDSRNSGEPQYGTGGESGYGSLRSGLLEMSNVDIAMEFTEMITTQRGFQANSRVITASDEMLQELVNIKR